MKAGMLFKRAISDLTRWSYYRNSDVIQVETFRQEVLSIAEALKKSGSLKNVKCSLSLIECVKDIEDGEDFSFEKFEEHFKSFD